jgi:hypothetical protein
LGEIGIDAPVAHRIGIGQRVSGNRAAETKMVKLCGPRAKASLDVAQAFAPRQLRKGQRQILVEAREPLDLAFAAIALDAASKRRQRQMLHHLGKHLMTFGHRMLPCGGRRKGLPQFSCKAESRPPQNLGFVHLFNVLPLIDQQTLGH